MLIKCEECQKEVSDKAKACPNCGAPIAVEDTLPSQATNQNNTQNNNHPRGAYFTKKSVVEKGVMGFTGIFIVFFLFSSASYLIYLERRSSAHYFS